MKVTPPRAFSIYFKSLQKVTDILKIRTKQFIAENNFQQINSIWNLSYFQPLHILNSG